MIYFTLNYITASSLRRKVEGPAPVPAVAQILDHRIITCSMSSVYWFSMQAEEAKKAAEEEAAAAKKKGGLFGFLKK